MNKYVLSIGLLLRVISGTHILADNQSILPGGCVKQSLPRRDVYSRLHEMNMSHGVAEHGKTFEIRRYCFPCEKWELKQPLPENIIFCGLEIKNEIFYQNEWVCGGVPILEYRYTFTTKVQLADQVHIAFELDGVLRQISFVEINFFKE